MQIEAQDKSLSAKHSFSFLKNGQLLKYVI
jgi:hypothetical protein